MIPSFIKILQYCRYNWQHEKYIIFIYKSTKIFIENAINM